MISRQLQRTFDWAVSDAEDQTTVTFTFPVTFNINCTKAELLYNNEVISVTIPDAPLLLYGLLFEPAQSINTTIDESTQTMTLTIQKSTPKSWPLLVKAFCPQTKAIDPKSAYILWRVLAQSEVSEDIKLHAAQLLEQSAQTGFLPSLKTLGNILIAASEETRAEGIRLLQVAAEQYQDAEALCQLGTILAVMPENHEMGMQMLERAREQGCAEAYLNLAQIASPVCDVCGKKDGARALELLQKYAETKDPNPVVYYEMAKLHKFGCEGVPKNEELADSLYAKASELMSQDGQTPPPLEPPKKTTSQNSYVVGGIVAVTLSIFCFAVFKHIWGNDRNSK